MEAVEKLIDAVIFLLLIIIFPAVLIAEAEELANQAGMIAAVNF